MSRNSCIIFRMIMVRLSFPKHGDFRAFSSAMVSVIFCAAVSLNGRRLDYVGGHELYTIHFQVLHRRAPIRPA